ncbi:MAG: hypothetical protein ACI4NM_04095 [Bullifex sp.]
MKKTLSILMVMLVCASLCFAGGSKESGAASVSEISFNKEGLPIVNEPVEFEIAAATQKNKDFKELQYFRDLEKDTNVIINWNMSSDDGWNEKKSLLFASNMLPDAFYGNDILTDVDIMKYGSQGMLIPLNDLIEEYAPNYNAILNQHPEYRSQLTAPDGNIYALGTINEINPTTHDHLFINKTWLDNLGLEVPTTIEEFEAVLRAFRDYDANGNGDPNDEIPFTFRYSSTDLYNRQQGIQSMFGIFGQLDDIYHFVVKDGKAVYTPATTEYRDAIEWFHKLYSEGLIDKEVFTHDKNVYVSKIQNPQNIVGMFLGWSASATAAANKGNYILMAPIENVNGEKIWRKVNAKVISRGAFAITNKCEHPEVLMRWIDQSFDLETSLEICQGMLGKALEKTEEGRYRFLPVPAGTNLDAIIHEYGPGNDGIFTVMNEIVEKLDLNANLQERKDNDIFLDPYLVPLTEMYPSVFFTEDEIEEVSVLQTDIDSYVLQKYASWIVDGGATAEWNTFQTKLKNMGVDRYIEIYQAALDRFYAK